MQFVHDIFEIAAATGGKTPDHIYMIEVDGTPKRAFADKAITSQTLQQMLLHEEEIVGGSPCKDYCVVRSYDRKDGAIDTVYRITELNLSEKG